MCVNEMDDIYNWSNRCDKDNISKFNILELKRDAKNSLI